MSDDGDGHTGERMRIGKVRDLLRDEFPDISISKLRFLEDRGIVEPERTPGGYRMYSPDDVRALAEALRMQRDEYKPLAVIRNELRRRLDADEAGTPDGMREDAQEQRPRHATPGEAIAAAMGHATAPGAAGAPGARPALAVDAEPQLVSRAALLRGAGADEELLAACIDEDIVTPQRDDEGDELFTDADLVMVSICARLVELGLDLRHVRQVAHATARQGAVVEQWAATMLRTPSAEQRDRAIGAVDELTGLLAQFMGAALVRDVRDVVDRARTSRRSSASGSNAAHLA